jgi:hypothetical protein
MFIKCKDTYINTDDIVVVHKTDLLGSEWAGGATIELSTGTCVLLSISPVKFMAFLDNYRDYPRDFPMAELDDACAMVCRQHAVSP